MRHQHERQNLAALVSVGDELAVGQTVDTNSAWLADQLARLGVRAIRHTTVADDAAATADAIALSARLAGWVIVTGGLGPTPDDLTREAAAGLLGQPLVERPEAIEQIRQRFARMNRPMATVNRVQALAPAGSQIIRNDWGTAPGLQFSHDHAECFCLPGVPSEMRSMFAASVAPAIRQRLGEGQTVAVRTVHTFGIGESDLAERLGELLGRGRSPQIGTTAGGGSVSVRIYAHGHSGPEATRQLDEAEAAVRQRIGPFCFGVDEDTLESAVGRLLLARGQTLAAAESCTGGLLGAMITATPGSSAYFLESAVCYANAAKTARLGVPAELIARDGAVSESVAAAMARSVRAASGADWAVSVTGIAGPGGGSPDKPVGLVFIGLAGPGDLLAVHRHVFPGDREAVRLRSARFALNHLRLALSAGA